MFNNYFIIALRNFWRNKVFSLINIVGLAIGICASLVIYLVVSYDFSFDKFEKDRDRIYRIVSTMHFPDQEFKNSGVPMPIPPAVHTEVTGIEVTAPFHTGNGDLDVSIAGAGKPVVYKKQKNVVYADNNYFKLFSYQWLAGSSGTSAPITYLGRTDAHTGGPSTTGLDHGRTCRSLPRTRSALARSGRANGQGRPPLVRSSQPRSS